MKENSFDILAAKIFRYFAVVYMTAALFMLVIFSVFIFPMLLAPISSSTLGLFVASLLLYFSTMLSGRNLCERIIEQKKAGPQKNEAVFFLLGSVYIIGISIYVVTLPWEQDVGTDFISILLVFMFCLLPVGLLLGSYLAAKYILLARKG